MKIEIHDNRVTVYGENYLLGSIYFDGTIVLPPYVSGIGGGQRSFTVEEFEKFTGLAKRITNIRKSSDEQLQKTLEGIIA